MNFVCYVLVLFLLFFVSFLFQYHACHILSARPSPPLAAPFMTDPAGNYFPARNRRIFRIFFYFQALSPSDTASFPSVNGIVNS